MNARCGTSLNAGLQLSVAVILVAISPGTIAQNPGAGLGQGIFNGTSAVLLRTMKAPTGVFSVGPRQLNFGKVKVTQQVMNVIIISNGTSSPAEIQTLEVRAGGFRLSSPVKLPMTMPPNTEFTLTVDFLPPHSGSHTGKILVASRTTKDRKMHRSQVLLKGEGVQK